MQADIEARRNQDGGNVDKRRLSNIEKYLVDMIDQKYARRIFQKMNTEWERLTLEHGSEPSMKEYEWMVRKALSIHRDVNLTKGLDDGTEEAEDTLRDSLRETS